MHEKKHSEGKEATKDAAKLFKEGRSTTAKVGNRIFGK
jgi:hypothetical protein